MDKKMLAIVAVVIIAIAAVAIVIVVNNNNNNDTPSEKITIIDGSGKTIVLDKPLTKIVTGNTNVPKVMNILGANDYVTGLSFYSAKSDDSNWEKFKGMYPKAKHMSIEPSLTAEELTPVAEAVIVPVSSMTISEAQEKSFEEMGIKVIRLNCNGDTAHEDMEKITIILGKPAKVMQNYDDYWTMYNSVKDGVAEKTKESSIKDARFLYYYNGLSAFYNQTSASSSLVESIFGKNSTRDIPNLDLSGISNKADELGMIEAVTKMDAEKPIDVILFRGNSTVSTSDAAAKLFKESVLMTKYADLSPMQKNRIFLFNSEMMSGTLSYVGCVLLAEVMGVDTGYDAVTLINQYNEKYGFSENTTGLVFHISIDGTDVYAEDATIVINDVLEAINDVADQQETYMELDDSYIVTGKLCTGSEVGASKARWILVSLEDTEEQYEAYLADETFHKNITSDTITVMSKELPCNHIETMIGLEGCGYWYVYPDSYTMIEYIGYNGAQYLWMKIKLANTDTTTELIDDVIAAAIAAL